MHYLIWIISITPLGPSEGDWSTVFSSSYEVSELHQGEWEIKMMAAKKTQIWTPEKTWVGAAEQVPRTLNIFL